MKRLKHTIVTIFLLATAINLLGQDNYVVGYGKMKVQWGNNEYIYINLYEDGKKIDFFKPELDGKFEFALELNHVYVFWFEKPGYVTKKVEFNTTVPRSVTSAPDFIPFQDFEFHVSLFEKFDNVDTMFFTKPVGKIKYSKDLNGFDWDKQYSLEIQRSMEELENQMTAKHEAQIIEEIRIEEEKKQQLIEAQRQAKIERELKEKEAKELEKAEREKKALAEEQAKILREKEQAELKAREKEEQEKLELAKKQAQIERDRLEMELKEQKRLELEKQALADEQARIQREREDADLKARKNQELAEKQAQLESEQKEKELKDIETAKIERQVLENEKAKLLKEKEELEKQELEEQKAKLEREQIEKEKQELALKQAQIEKEKQEKELMDRQKAAEMARNKKLQMLAEKKMQQNKNEVNLTKTTEVNKTYGRTSKNKIKTSPLNNSEEQLNKVNTVEVAGRTITRTPITIKEITLIYVKVEYSWGGRFFFIEEEPGEFRNISEQYYIKMVGIK